MSESADVTYEELHAQIAELRKTIAEKDLKIKDLVQDAVVKAQEIYSMRMKHEQVQDQVLKLALDNNKTIQSLIAEKRYYND